VSVLSILIVLLAAPAGVGAQPIQEQRVGPVSAVVQAGHPCLGRWVGQAEDHPPTSGRPNGVTIEIHQTQGRNCGTIEYTLGCGGVLHDCRVTADRIEALEEYTHNPGTCAPAGRFAASCTEVMEWRWDETTQAAGQYATGRLRRAGAAGPGPLPPVTPGPSATGGCGCAIPGAPVRGAGWSAAALVALLVAQRVARWIAAIRASRWKGLAR
jgi:hypothetical protein